MQIFANLNSKAKPTMTQNWISKSLPFCLRKSNPNSLECFCCYHAVKNEKENPNLVHKIKYVRLLFIPCKQIIYIRI